MIDIHTHILPGLDDGAADIYDSIEMAALAYESGTTAIVATPHCNLPGLYSNYFGKDTVIHIPDKGNPEGRAAGDHAARRDGGIYHGGCAAASDGRKDLPHQRTRYVLMEFDFGEDPDFASRILRQVKEIRALPVVAHAERYEFVQDDPSIAYE